MFGKNIRQVNDPLVKIQLKDLVWKIKKPDSELKSFINKLQIISTLDQNRYRNLKTQLPYITPSIFQPPYRNTKNFISVSYVILDIDHVSDSNTTAIDLKEKLKTDQHIKVAFLSPSGNGVKIICELKEKCFDAARFKIFYKAFARNFAEKHHILNQIDLRTNDVTRACFLNHDPNIWYNENAQPVDINDYVDFEDLQSVKLIDKELKNNKEETETHSPRSGSELSELTLQQIKEKLNPKVKAKPNKNIYVPEELENAIEKVHQAVIEYNIEIVEILNINYGKKFRFRFKEKLAEINLFYGKKGYTVVISPKRGTDTELNEICFRILTHVFY